MGSFLAKKLLASWQWVAGFGADASTYFLKLIPTLRGQKTEPVSAHLRLCVLELAQFLTWFPHAHGRRRARRWLPLKLGLVRLSPIIGHEQARARALPAFAMTGNHALYEPCGSFVRRRPTE